MDPGSKVDPEWILDPRWIRSGSKVDPTLDPGSFNLVALLAARCWIRNPRWDAGLVVGRIAFNYIGRCGFAFLLDASLVAGRISFELHWSLWLCVLVGCRLGRWAHFFLITLVVVALLSCRMPAWSLGAFLFNYIVRCGFAFLSDASLVVGRISF